MIRPEITQLYKYYRFNERTLAMLADKTAWLSTPNSFNDPFDCAIGLDHDRMEESINQALSDAYKIYGGAKKEAKSHSDDQRKFFKEAYDKLNTSINHIFQKAGIFSLSEANDDILMWSHYADYHRGFCVGYERSDDNFLGVHAEPVIYQKNYPSLSAKDITSDGGQMNVLWLTKSDHWSYEKEWRIIQKEGNKLFQFPCNILTIIFGMKMSEENRTVIRTILGNEQNFQYKGAAKSRKGFWLDLVNID